MTAHFEATPPRLAVEVAHGRALAPVWRNGMGGTTWRVGSGTSLNYLKVGPLHREFQPFADAERYRWVARWLAAPTPISVGERDGWGWFESTPVPGQSAVGKGKPKEFVDNPDGTARALGAMLRQFHDALPVTQCPFTWSAIDRLALCQPEAAVELGQPPAIGDDLVVCHGDACNPNFLLHRDFSPAGYVDLARVGVADRWADLAPAVLSVGWNFPPGLAPLLLEGYGVGHDIESRPDKLDWYTRLWNAPEAER